MALNICSTFSSKTLSMALGLVLGVVLATSSSCLLFVVDQNNSPLSVQATHSNPITLSYNRYQAGFACRENGWEFCQGWVYRRGRLA
ncbi:hypothetical protein [Shewanella sp. UCD-KL12]|uniref:hypothetical protein n=1 Tax=Shewanella sp. UCD-KL12 TaxID=1917163 RepID=UPI000970B661|nr:hypothetical protein [Shewanella sp. UCD-KL12]